MCWADYSLRMSTAHNFQSFSQAANFVPQSLEVCSLRATLLDELGTTFTLPFLYALLGRFSEGRQDLTGVITRKNGSAYDFTVLVIRDAYFCPRGNGGQENHYGEST